MYMPPELPSRGIDTSVRGVKGRGHIQVQADGLPRVLGGGLRMVLGQRLGLHGNRREEKFRKREQHEQRPGCRSAWVK